VNNPSSPSQLLSSGGGATVSPLFAHRDVLCQRPPRILHSQAEVYATNAILGASTFVGLRMLGFSPLVRVAGGFTVGFASRILAWKYGVRLPSWFQAPDTVGDEPLNVLDPVEVTSSGDMEYEP
jgi:uncharacterized membrane protein YeiH